MSTRAQTASIDISHGERARLEKYLGEHIEAFAGPLRIERFPGGQSNPTFRLTASDNSYVMRCKPAPAAQLLPSAHAIDREYRIQAALAGTGVPVARMLCLCEDETVIGRAFYVMQQVSGRIFWDASLPTLSRAERAAVFDEMNRVIALLHRVDVNARGLADYGKAGNYFARQIARWSRQYRASETEPIEAMDRLIDWLPAHIPQELEAPVSIVHGDFRIDNLIFHPTEMRILAVIDWELSTLGHPLADFAYLTLCWHLAERGLAGRDLGMLGIPGEDEYWATYSQRTGLAAPPGDRRFYLIYNLFRIAGILQGIAKRAAEGTASSADASDFGRTARPRAELAWQLAQDMGA